jgi:hypothetical protein
MARALCVTIRRSVMTCGCQTGNGEENREQSLWLRRRDREREILNPLGFCAQQGGLLWNLDRGWYLQFLEGESTNYL